MLGKFRRLLSSAKVLSVAHNARRDLATQVVPISQPWPGIPQLLPANNLPAPVVQISTLSNGLRVATQETYGQVSSMALFVDAGSMYESTEAIGSCHFLETMAFKSTESRSAEAIAALTQEHGIATSAVFNREVLMYKVDCLRGDVHKSLSLLGEAVAQPRLTDEELHQARQVIAFQRDEALSQPQVLVSEHLYAAAYGRETPLGRPEKCPDSRVDAVDAATLRRFRSRFFTAPRMVLSAVGVDHDVVVAAANEFFSGIPRSGSDNTDAALFAGRPAGAYLGGDVRSSPDWSALPPTAAASQAKTEFTHMMMAFPTVGWSKDDVVPVCVVDTLLGGGSSFSAGGPGKGMYSRLYREVLNSFAWTEAANAFSTQLYDSGIVGVYGSASPEHAGDLLNVLSNHLVRLTDTPVKQAELVRARNQLASSVMMNLETRGLLCEDIGRQILSHGKRLDPAELLARIQSVSQADIVRVMRAALAHPPSIAAVGDTGKLPEYGTLRDFFANAAARHRA